MFHCGVCLCCCATGTGKRLHWPGVGVCGMLSNDWSTHQVLYLFGAGYCGTVAGCLYWGLCVFVLLQEKDRHWTTVSEIGHYGHCQGMLRKLSNMLSGRITQSKGHSLKLLPQTRVSLAVHKGLDKTGQGHLPRLPCSHMIFYNNFQSSTI